MHYAEKVAAAVDAKKISMSAHDHIQRWLAESTYAEYREEVERLIDQAAWQQLEDHFFTVVPFGTGGRRGKVGVGPNRINRVTIGESAQGLANYLLKQGADTQARGVVIGYDTRVTSVEFAELCAAVLAANGFTVYLFDGFRATPELSFAVRHLQTAAGVVISASHNPPGDNGFKAYWSDGGQIVPPHDAGIMNEVDAVAEIKQADFKAAVRDAKIKMIGQEIDEAYVRAVCQESLLASRSAVIAYSPLHGSGSRNVWPVLQAAGFTHLTHVAEQAEPDGNFPNIPNHIPNPEVREASALVTEYAQRLGADLAITTDPDADRLGVVARDRNGGYQFLTGNQIAALIGFYVLDQQARQGKLTARHFVVKTIVTTDLLTALARDFGVKLYDNILIGFKYVAELIALHEGGEEFLLGGEESHGILKGTYTRDKDAAVAALLIGELTSHLKDQGKTLIDQLNELYRRYGVYHETLQNIAYPGADGSATMARLMSGLRQNPPRELAGRVVVSVIDRLDPSTEGTKGNVLIYHLSPDKQARVTVRPSGTEPKLKIYTQVHLPVATDASDEQLRTTKQSADASAHQINQAVTAYFASLLQR